VDEMAQQLTTWDRIGRTPTSVTQASSYRNLEIVIRSWLTKFYWEVHQPE
jgi:hypothetical protein